jgi:hypothetical protein
MNWVSDDEEDLSFCGLGRVRGFGACVVSQDWAGGGQSELLGQVFRCGTESHFRQRKRLDSRSGPEQRQHRSHRVELGKRTTSRCPFNGSDGDYTSPGGGSGRCKAQLKAKQLILESVVAARPQPTTPAVHMHTKERWQLSTDAKTLIIKSDVDFLDFPSDLSAALAGTTSRTTKYTRTQSP